MKLDFEQYRLIVESSPNMIWRSNLTTECDYFNKTWLDFTGHSFEDECGFGWAKGVHPDDYDRCVKIYLDNFKQQARFEMDYRLKRHDGQYRWINDRGVPIYNSDGTFIGFIGSCMDITEKVEGQLLIRMAQYDALCNIFNRQYVLQRLQELFDNAKEHKTNLFIIMFDIDDFKAINDLYGHITGDKVLSHVSSITRYCLPQEALIGRYGGDEFIIGLSNMPKEQAIALAEKIRFEVESKLFKDGQNTSLKLRISVGVKQWCDETTLTALINEADINLYKAKRRGKNLVVYE